MAWAELAAATGDSSFSQCYDRAEEAALAGAASFLPGSSERAKVMDRLHPYLYFLESLTPRAAEPRCAAALRDGIDSVATLLRDLAPEIARSDVYAQLLRVRLLADSCGAAPLDGQAAHTEAEALATFQAPCGNSDARIAGGFYFGRNREGMLPYVNPVSAAFALQALAWWNGGSPKLSPLPLI
jgi:hypothetical protein